MQSKTCTVIGGGESVSDLDRTKIFGHDLIVVNKTLVDFPSAKYFITMDQTAIPKIKMKSRILSETRAKKIFVLNRTHDYIQKVDGEIKDVRFNLTYKFDDFDYIVEAFNVEPFSLDKKEFAHGDNSGFCAIQLAIMLGYKEINLVGFDYKTKKQTHYHEGYGEKRLPFNKKLDHYFNVISPTIQKFTRSNPDIHIFNCSKEGRLSKLLPYKDLNK